MNEATQTTEFVLRRLTEPLRFFGYEPRPIWWLVILGVVLALGFFYVGWMYVKDSRGVGPWWAIFLGLLRCSVYLILAAVFLLPAYQSWEETESRSKVVVLFDVSPSVTSIIDDIPTESQPLAKLPTRQDKVLKFLAEKDNHFLRTLLEKNPVTAYRFARGLDDQFYHFADGVNWTRDEWEEQVRKLAAKELVETSEPAALPGEFWSAWLRPAAPATASANWSEPNRARFEKLTAYNAKLQAAGFFYGTNPGEALLSTANREINNMLQGIVVFTDGRATEGSEQAYRDLEQRAKAARIPIFVVAVGDDRPQVRIDIADLRVPEQIQPEDKFRAVLEVAGEGLPEKDFDAYLDITSVRRTKDGKEEPLDIVVVEADDKAAPGKKREEIVLGRLITVPAKAKFDKSTPTPRAEVEFQLDAATLAKAAGRDLPTDRKWEVAETKDGELRFRARVPKDRLEIFEAKEHVSDAADLRVQKKPLRVLLFASAPTRDYQFIRTMLVREMEKKRAEVAIHLQLPPGKTERRTGIVQDVPPERLLPIFPNRLDAGSDKPDEKLFDLSEYDVILAFDPDWTQLSEEQLRLVARWVDKGGGLVVVGGPINTLQLARPGANRDKLKPMLDLYPVVLKDIRIEELDRTTTDPWPLVFDAATPDMEFLKLAEDDGKGGPPLFLADWHQFFGRSDKGLLENGFYNYYPVEMPKAGALVVARFADPRARLKDNTLQPYLVVSDPASGRRVVWIGWGETWRLRKFSEMYFERFWLKLARYAGAGNQGRINKRISLVMGRTFTANKFVEIDAKIDNKGGEPLPKTAKPTVTLKLPAGVPEKEIPTQVPLKPKPGSDGWFTAKFQVRSPGEYGLELKVPETGDSQSGKFVVKEANPELDNTRPDFELLYRIASPAADVLARLPEADRVELKRRLQRAKPEAADAKPAVTPATKDKEEDVRLYFDLKSAEDIPRCMVTAVKNQRNRGPIRDLWDEGFTLWTPEPPAAPVTLSHVLLLVVGLLCVEWLTRKLLRLA